MTIPEQKIKDKLKQHADEFHPVVSFDPQKDKLLLFDFTGNNPEITENILDDSQKFTNYINQKLQAANAKFGIGGYDEHRSVYSRSKLFDSNSTKGERREGNFDSPSTGGGKGEAEPRRLHLGIDIWGKPYTPVMSPLDGIIHSFAFNNNFGDYGATLILTHTIDDFHFHSLYGHLSLNSLKNLSEGQTVKKGDVIAEFGIRFENGQWPPHLHFQLIIDMEDWKGDYPGVCKLSEREKYLANCPDPDLVLQMMKYARVDSQ